MIFDFYNLPEPKSVVVPDASQILKELQNTLPADLQESAKNPASPIYRLLEVFAFREVYFKNLINEQTKALFIAYASGGDLDQFGANRGIKRKLIQAEDKNKNIPAIYESDENFRQRIILSLNGLTNAGTPSAYRHHALTVDDSIKDASAVNFGSGNVLVTLLSYQKDGVVLEDVIRKANKYLNSDNVKPLCDVITVAGAVVNRYDLKVRVFFKTNVDALAEIQKLKQLAQDFNDEKFYLGKSIFLSQIIKKLHLSVIEKLNIVEPASDLISKPEEAFLLNNTEFEYAFME